jgi:transposase-like protein
MEMSLASIYRRFPTSQDCLHILEAIRWQGGPQCPYCNSGRHTTLARENRYHCNNCNASYSVTVRTVFHKTRVDLQKWFLIIAQVMTAKKGQKGLSARQLAAVIEVNKNTACYMAMRIRIAGPKDNDLFLKITDEVTR